MKRLINITLCLALAAVTAVAQPKIGLALGGGGAKGAAEVGVLKVLEEAGIKPSMPDTDVTSFGNKKSAIMIQQGEAAARKQLPQIYKLTLPQL
jgi:tetrahydromethanopterin S-methyltransferase subunit H